MIQRITLLWRLYKKLVLKKNNNKKYTFGLFSTEETEEELTVDKGVRGDVETEEDREDKEREEEEKDLDNFGEETREDSWLADKALDLLTDRNLTK